MIASEYSDYKASSTPPPNRHVSLASLNSEFNHVVFMDHMSLDRVTVLHMMDVATRYSFGSVVQSREMEHVIYNLEDLQFSQFWPSSAIHAKL